MESRSVVRSIDFHGYSLAPLGAPRICAALPNFSQYLVLEREEAEDFTIPALQLLVPDGQISQWPVVIPSPTAWGVERQVFCYSMHPRLGYLQAETVPARLHLAAL